VTTTITATAEAAGIRLQADTTEAAAAYMTITRTVAGQVSYVRWARVAAATTSLTVLDLEAPEGVTAVYTLTVLSAASATLATDTDTATYVSDGLDRLINYSGPSMYRTIAIESFNEVETDARGGVFDILGRRSRVAVMDTRSGEAGTITVIEADRGESLREWLKDGSIVGLRTPAARGYGTPVAYSVGKARTSRVGLADDALRRVTFDITEVDVPVPSLQSATPITWDALVTYAATWADVKSEPGWPTWYKVKTVPTSAL
jgi:hypothetical protein